jgi:hypothetical protein
VNKRAATVDKQSAWLYNNFGEIVQAYIRPSTERPLRFSARCYAICDIQRQRVIVFPRLLFSLRNPKRSDTISKNE